jgi:hypothetical protein
MVNYYVIFIYLFYMKFEMSFNNNNNNDNEKVVRHDIGQKRNFPKQKVL